MRKLYLKRNVIDSKDKFTFFDEHQQEVYQGLQTSMSLPPRFGLVDIDKNKQVITLTGTTFSMMPEFKMTDSETNSVIVKIKKKFTLNKGKVTIKTPQGEYIIVGDFVARDFKVLDNQQQEIISVHPSQISWGEISEVNIDTSLIAEHIAVGILLGIECAYYSDNKY